MRIENLMKTFALATAMTATPIITNTVFATTALKKDMMVDRFEHSITPQGSTDKMVLSKAPKPFVYISGEKKIAGIVIDLETNVLYRYNKEGKPIKAYLIASGRESMQTKRGIRIVTHTEKYPYTNAPKHTNRRKHPNDFGPYVLCLNKLDPQTGIQSSTGQFIHGCRDYNATFVTNPRRYVSHGCIRMEKSAITGLATGETDEFPEENLKVKPGELVIIR